MASVDTLQWIRHMVTDASMSVLLPPGSMPVEGRANMWRSGWGTLAIEPMRVQDDGATTSSGTAWCLLPGARNLAVNMYEGRFAWGEGYMAEAYLEESGDPVAIGFGYTRTGRDTLLVAISTLQLR